jgi:hypothetical protein
MLDRLMSWTALKLQYHPVHGKDQVTVETISGGTTAAGVVGQIVINNNWTELPTQQRLFGFSVSR